MFDVSFTELLVIGVVALIVIGPERLPKVAKTVGHLLGRAQRYVSDVKGDIRREIELDELRQFKSEMDDAAQSVQSSLRETESSLRAPAEQLRNALDKTAQDARAGLNGTSSSPAADTAPPQGASDSGGSAVSDVPTKAEAALPVTPPEAVDSTDTKKPVSQESVAPKAAPVVSPTAAFPPAEAAHQASATSEKVSGPTDESALPSGTRS